MLILAIETSGRRGSIALCDDAVLLGERALDVGRQHGQSLVPEIHDLLRACGTSPRQCRLIAVSVGPGSYTGVRVGVVCAKTLAYVTGAAGAAVETMTAIAWNAPPDATSLQVVSDAQRQELYVGHFEREGETWRRLGDVAIVPTEAWIEGLKPGEIVSGPGLEKIEVRIPPHVARLPRADWEPQARWIAYLGWKSAQAGRVTDAWNLAPLYLRRSSAEIQWDALGRP